MAKQRYVDAGLEQWAVYRHHNHTHSGGHFYTVISCWDGGKDVYLVRSDGYAYLSSTVTGWKGNDLYHNITHWKKVYVGKSFKDALDFMFAQPDCETTWEPGDY